MKVNVKYKDKSFVLPNSGTTTLKTEGKYTSQNILLEVEDAGIDPSTATATASLILSGKTAYINGSTTGNPATGTMANNGAVTGTISTKAGEYTIPAGYHDGSGRVSIDSTELAKIIEGNIKSGIQILGVTGTYSGAGVTAQAKTTDPSESEQTISPDTGYDYLSKVTVTAIPKKYKDASSTTVTADKMLAGVKAIGYDSATESATEVTGNIASLEATSYTPSSIDLTIDAGKYLSGVQTIKGDANLKQENIKSGVSIFGISGNFTSDANAVAGDILAGKSAYVNGAKVTGSIESKAAETFTPTTTDQTIAANQYLAGAQTIQGDANLVTGNIKAGTTIFGVSGKTEVVDTTETTKPASEALILEGQIAFVNGSKVTGTIPTWDGEKKETPKTLRFIANAAPSTIKMVTVGSSSTAPNLQYSTDGLTWSTFTPGTTLITLANVGDIVYFKGNNTGISAAMSNYWKFEMSGSIAASGNIMGLLDDGKCESKTIGGTWCFTRLFENCTALTTAPELPATTLGLYCYHSMFLGCSSLIEAPSLPATTLIDQCYLTMFSGCTSLTTPPELPATTFATSTSDQCYYGMFSGCTSLIKVPVLHIGQLSGHGDMYGAMFSGCTSLYISNSNVPGEAEYAWKIPAEGTFNVEKMYFEFIKNTAGSHGSNHLYAKVDEYKVYYTKYPPIG